MADELLLADPWLTQGPTTITSLELLRKVIVQVKDAYFDERRIVPTRMMAEMRKALVAASKGALHEEGEAIVAPDGEHWTGAPIDSIWSIPLTVRSLGEHLQVHLRDSDLLRGHYAEVVLIDALLGTLDAPSVFLTPALRLKRRGAALAPTGERDRGRLPLVQPAALTAPLASGHVDLPGNLRLLRPPPFLPIVAAATRDLIEGVNPQDGGVAGVILDLRGHAGGTLEGAAKLADVFLDEAQIAILVGRQRQPPLVARSEGGLAEQARLVVLVDEGTAAGAEIVAGALRRSGRALLVGRPTVGAGLIQVFYDFKDKVSGDETQLVLTVAEALLPGHVHFDRLGIAPDVEVGTPAGPARAPACQPIGETIARVRGGPHAEVDVAAAILRRAASASVPDLIAAAKAVAGERTLTRAPPAYPTLASSSSKCVSCLKLE